MIPAGLLVLRLVLAFVLVSHGGHTLVGLGAGGGLGPGGLQQAAARYAAAGLEPGIVVAAIVGFVQLAAGLCIGIGWLTRWAACAAAGVTAVLLWKVHAPWGFYLNWTGDPTRGHGLEYSLVLMGAVTTLVLTGAGDWSIDGRRASATASRAAGRARLRGRA